MGSRAGPSQQEVPAHKVGVPLVAPHLANSQPPLHLQLYFEANASSEELTPHTP